MEQRFITGLEVFDTYSGLGGTIQEMNLDVNAVPAHAPLYTGAFFTVKFSSQALQVFTTEGRRVDHATGEWLDGITLLTKLEYIAIVAVGYPK